MVKGEYINGKRQVYKPYIQHSVCIIYLNCAVKKSIEISLAALNGYAYHAVFFVDLIHYAHHPSSHSLYQSIYSLVKCGKSTTTSYQFAFTPISHSDFE